MDDDIWIGLAHALPVDPLDEDIGGAYGHVLALAGDRPHSAARPRLH